MTRLLSINSDAKTIKGVKKGYLTGILYLIPSPTLCPCCSEGCRKSCLVSAGHGRMKSVFEARRKKTLMYLKNPSGFENILMQDVAELVRKAEKKKLLPCVRINGTSDIDVQGVFKGLLKAYPGVHFYDYTKDWSRRSKFSNYDLCYSRSERTSEETIKEFTRLGHNVAVVFDKVPEYWRGIKVINGDESDLRFLDERGIIVGLKAKGAAKHDTTGFVVRAGT